MLNLTEVLLSPAAQRSEWLGERVPEYGQFVLDPGRDLGVRMPGEENGRVLVTVRSREAEAPPVEVPLVPYHEWAERGPSTMRVWIPTT